MAELTFPLRILIAAYDPAYQPVTERLMRALRQEPEAFDLHVGEPSIVDHIGYHDDDLSSVIWTAEPGTVYYRLNIRPGRHQVFDDLLDIILTAHGRTAS